MLFRIMLETKQLLVLSDFYSIYFPFYQSQYGPATVLQNIFFCVQHKTEINTGLGQHVSE